MHKKQKVFLLIVRVILLFQIKKQRQKAGKKKRKQERKKERNRKERKKKTKRVSVKERERFMAAFVCEVVLDLAQCVWAELHFANYFPVAEFSAWSSSLALRREAQR